MDLNPAEISRPIKRGRSGVNMSSSFTLHSDSISVNWGGPSEHLDDNLMTSPVPELDVRLTQERYRRVQAQSLFEAFSAKFKAVLTESEDLARENEFLENHIALIEAEMEDCRKALKKSEDEKLNAERDGVMPDYIKQIRQEAVADFLKSRTWELLLRKGCEGQFELGYRTALRQLASQNMLRPGFDINQMHPGKRDDVEELTDEYLALAQSEEFYHIAFPDAPKPPSTV